MDDELRTTASALLDGAPCAVILPAGSGKTHLVAAAAAIGAERGRRLLLLTHTHAGVDAVRRRTRELGVGARQARVTTIDSWSQRLVTSFPRLSGYEPGTTVEWARVHDAGARALQRAHIADMLRVSYDYVVVDEYQDCTKQQHSMIALVAGIVPTAILGDPLQGIFNFGGNALVDWDTDVAQFPPLTASPRPWRWKGHNEALGDFLRDVRGRLERQEPVDLKGAPVTWQEDTNDNRRKACWSRVSAPGSVVILERFDAQCEQVARGLGGHFSVMEELEGKNLHDLARAADAGDGVRLAAATVKFACKSHAKLPPDLKQKGQKMATGAFPKYRSDSALAPTLAALEAEARDPSATTLSSALDAIEALGGKLFRKEAWYDMRRAVRAWQDGSAGTLSEAVRSVRDQTRIVGRRAARRSVSRPLLVKGQEFDECVILGADRLTPKELYVAMTRPRSRLTVLSASPVLNPGAPPTR